VLRTICVSADEGYPLGYSDHEARRLERQAVLLEDSTVEVLRRAGLAPGMRVLDLGSGMGDVSLLAATLVGSSGSVLGLERAASSVEAAGRRAASLGFNQVRFLAAELNTFTPREPVDAIIGRLVLLYLPDPAEVLRRLAVHLRPGGVVAFLEFDLPPVSQAPPSDLFVQMRHWMLTAFGSTGAELEMGSKLHRTFRRAGLPAPQMRAFTRVESEPYAYEYFVDTLRTMLPLVERSGVARLEDIQIDTLAARLAADSRAHERVVFLPRLVGAWTQRPPE
jgi:ubiquinone/menaquinone biosynthesis C-methylase UbiE